MTQLRPSWRDCNFLDWRGTCECPAGWHAFRRGLATNLHTLGVDDKTIQAILRHSNVALTISVYIKSVTESQVNVMDVLSARLEEETSNNLPKSSQRLVN
jgi:integrase